MTLGLEGIDQTGMVICSAKKFKSKVTLFRKGHLCPRIGAQAPSKQSSSSLQLEYFANSLETISCLDES